MSYRRSQVYAYTARPLGEQEPPSRDRTGRTLVAMGLTGALGLAAIGYLIRRTAQMRDYSRSARRWG